MNIKHLSAGLLVAGALYSGVAAAEETVTIGGWNFTCPNSCIVTPLGGGSYTVQDSQGGTIKITEVGTTEEN